MGSTVQWPSRGNRGKGSSERRNDERVRKAQSMTKVATETGIYYHGHTKQEYYDRKTDRIIETYVIDDSITKQQHLTLFDRRNSLLRRSNPFAMPADLKQESSRTKRIKLDPDSPRFERNSK